MKYNTIEEQQEALLKPFYAEEIEWRISRYGVTANGKPWAIVLAYINARAIMDRLDEVFGVNNWQDSYTQAQDFPYYERGELKQGAGIICTVAVRFVGTDEWISKSDGAALTEVEPYKGGLSDAIKRTAVKFGVGRYLYHLEDGFAECVVQQPSNWKVDGWKRVDDKKTSTTFYWKAPKLPAWALPKGER